MIPKPVPKNNTKTRNIRKGGTELVLTNSVQAVSNGLVDPASDLLVLTVQNVLAEVPWTIGADGLSYPCPYLTNFVVYHLH